jgi:hypothetical protein
LGIHRYIFKNVIFSINGRNLQILYSLLESLPHCETSV